MINHQRVHTGKSSYLCRQCDKCFTQKKNLFKHQIIRIGEKLFCYRQFNKCLTQKLKMAEIYLNHSEEKPFPFNQCEKAFTWNHGIHNEVKILMQTYIASVLTRKIPPMRRNYILIPNVPLLYGTKIKCMILRHQEKIIGYQYLKIIIYLNVSKDDLLQNTNKELLWWSIGGRSLIYFSVTYGAQHFTGNIKFSVASTDGL